MKQIFLLLILSFLFVKQSQAQATDFEVSLEEFTISGFDGIHSAAFAEHQGKWLIVGGRLNGLHAYLPPSAFPPYTQNLNLIVLDIANSQIWTADASVLPTNIREHISSSNAQYAQAGDYLYVVGGYGYTDSLADFITFPQMTAIDVPAVIDAVQNHGSILPYFRQITDQVFAVTGGNLQKMGNDFYLVMGHRFDGRYNHNSGATYTQSYTHQIRRFRIDDNGTNLSISNYSVQEDTTNLHRRDYNLVPQIFAGGVEGITAFSGVFQKGKDLPFLNSVDITPNGFVINNSFQQNLNQYHTAHLPVYDSLSDAMHTLFFGGMSRFRPDSLNPNLLKEDTLIPFVKTISQVTRYNNAVIEKHLPIMMPAYLGSNAEFLPLKSSYFTETDILRLDKLDTTKTLVGYILGGIESPYPNIFRGNESESFPSARIFKVYVHKSATTDVKNAIFSQLNLHCFPNPAYKKVNIAFQLPQKVKISIFITNTDGQVIEKLAENRLFNGKNQMVWEAKNVPSGIYFCNFQIGNYVQSAKIVLDNH